MQKQTFTIAGFKVQNKAQLIAVWHVVANDTTLQVWQTKCVYAFECYTVAEDATAEVAAIEETITAKEMVSNAVQNAQKVLATATDRAVIYAMTLGANDANTLAAKAEADKAQKALHTWQRVSTWHGSKIREAICKGELQDVMLYS